MTETCKISKEKALQLLDEWIKNVNLKKHCLAVGQAMQYYARLNNLPDNEVEKWQVAGLLHDLDWEKYPNEHPKQALKLLQDLGASKDVINAVASHGFAFGVEPTTLMARTLRAVDELAGFIVAVALVKGHDLSKVEVKSVKKKLKDKSFARGVSREDIYKGVEELSIDLDTHIQNVINALMEIKDVLEL